MNHKAQLCQAPPLAPAVLAASVLALAGCTGGVPASAVGRTADYRGGPVVRGSLITDVAQATPGEAFEAGVLLQMEPGWHVYWRNSGDSGMPTRLTWSAAGAAVGEATWPMPLVKRDEEGGMTTYEYGGPSLISVPVTAAPGSRASHLSLAVKVDLLACKEVCVRGSLSLRREVALGAGPAGAPSRLAREAFGRQRLALPRPARRLGFEQSWRLVALDRAEGRVTLQAELACAADDCPGLAAPRRSDDAFLPLAGPLDAVRVERVEVFDGGRGARLLISADIDPGEVASGLKIRGIISLNGPDRNPVALEVGGDLQLPQEDEDA